MTFARGIPPACGAARLTTCALQKPTSLLGRGRTYRASIPDAKGRRRASSLRLPESDGDARVTSRPAPSTPFWWLRRKDGLVRSAQHRGCVMLSPAALRPLRRGDAERPQHQSLLLRCLPEESRRGGIERQVESRWIVECLRRMGLVAKIWPVYSWDKSPSIFALWLDPSRVGRTQRLRPL